jgi:hypothetical protein
VLPLCYHSGNLDGVLVFNNASVSNFLDTLEGSLVLVDTTQAGNAALVLGTRNAYSIDTGRLDYRPLIGRDHHSRPLHQRFLLRNTIRRASRKPDHIVS